MRVVETCTCGASIEVNWTAPNSRFSYGQVAEDQEAKKQIATFRRAHKRCLAVKLTQRKES